MYKNVLPSATKKRLNLMNTNRTQNTDVNNIETTRLCLHRISKEKRVDRYEFRCQPTLARLLREKGAEWTRQTLIEKFIEEEGE